MKTIKQTYHIHSPIEKVWQALVNPKDIDGWGAGPAKMGSTLNSNIFFAQRREWYAYRFFA